MATDEKAKQPSVIFCSCAHFDVIDQAARRRIFGVLQEAPVAVETVADLCGLAAGRDSRLERWAKSDSLAIVACYPRAVRCLFKVAGVTLDEEKVRFFNMRTQSPEEILAGLLGDEVPDAAGEAAPPGKEEGWVPWFPVIDHDLCRNCKQCLNFCLFGVYGLSPEGQVQVQNPSGCKTNCPACARVCPASAIIFPKYGESPINGDIVTESEATAEKPAPDLRAMLQGNVYDRIRQRQPGRRRFATERPTSSETNADAPQPTMEALRRDLAIPRDVLASLSPAELARLRRTSQPDGSDGSPNSSRD